VLTEKEIATLGSAGAMAPSGGNEQPWRVCVIGNRMLIRSDDQRSDNSFLDVDGYAADFAVGCFAENVAITAQALGLEYTEKSSDGTVEFGFTGRRNAAGHRLAESIAQRVTNRRSGDGTVLTEAELDPLVTAVEPGYTVTAVSTPDAKSLIGRALGIADVVRLRNPTMFADMVREMCWTDRETEQRRDGLDLRTLELPGSTVKLLSLLRKVRWLRHLLPASKLAETARSLVADSSHICCLSTRKPLTPGTMVDAGRSLQRLWLEATRAGISVHPWTVGPLLLARLETFQGKDLTGREQQDVGTVGTMLRQGFDLHPQDHPVFVFRLFTSPPAKARSLRLPWQSFTTIQESADGPR
jgi:hypothetical protein